jgi:hypothetical protein
MILPFSDEQFRLLVNLESQYTAWLEAARKLAELPYGMRWMTVRGKHYLYELLDRGGNGKSLGPRSLETEARHDAYVREKEDITYRRDRARDLLGQSARIYRALRLPLIASSAAKILVEADLRGLLGRAIMVVGTNAVPAYEIEAGGRIEDVPGETDDFDLAWTSSERRPDDMPLWSMLKAADATFTVNTERSFQARNRDAYAVEILAAPSRAAGMSRRDRPMPVPLEEQEWLLLGRPVARVAVARDGTPARLVVPDPRWFALQKLWLSEQAKRDPLKRPKDLKQGRLLLDAVKAAMPQYPLDGAFEAQLPDALRPYYERWTTQSGR